MYHHDIICAERETATVTALKPGHATLTVAHNSIRRNCVLFEILCCRAYEYIVMVPSSNVTQICPLK